jgi:hypothetical protein
MYIAEGPTIATIGFAENAILTMKVLNMNRVGKHY